MSAGEAQHSCHVAKTDIPWASEGCPSKLSPASAGLAISAGVRGGPF